MRVSLPLASLLLTSVFALIATGAEARLAGVRDSFENGNSGGWASQGNVRIVTPAKGTDGAKAHGGKSFVVMANPMPFPGTGMTNLIVIQAAKGAPCSLDLWVNAPGPSGTLTISVRDSGPTGPLLANRAIAAPTRGKSKRTNGYSAYQLNFAHSGAPLFVALEATGPTEIAIDDFSLACRTR